MPVPDLSHSTVHHQHHDTGHHHHDTGDHSHSHSTTHSLTTGGHLTGSSLTTGHATLLGSAKLWDTHGHTVLTGAAKLGNTHGSYGVSPDEVLGCGRFLTCGSFLSKPS